MNKNVLSVINLLSVMLFFSSFDQVGCIEVLPDILDRITSHPVYFFNTNEMKIDIEMKLFKCENPSLVFIIFQTIYLKRLNRQIERLLQGINVIFHEVIISQVFLFQIYRAIFILIVKYQLNIS